MRIHPVEGSWRGVVAQRYLHRQWRGREKQRQTSLLGLQGWMQHRPWPSLAFAIAIAACCARGGVHRRAGGAGTPKVDSQPDSPDRGPSRCKRAGSCEAPAWSHPRFELVFGCGLMVEWQPSLMVRLQGSNSSSTIRRFKDDGTTFLSAKDLFLAACGGRSSVASL